MSKQPTAIVIGAGIGGLGTAIQLAKTGFRVKIYEKNKKSGGRCQQIVKDGHIFDTGPTMYLFPDMFSDFFASVDEDINQYLKLLRVEPTYLLSFADSSDLVVTADMKLMEKQLEALEPGSYKKYVRYLTKSKDNYLFAQEHITKNSLRYQLDYFNLNNLVNVLKNRALYPHAFYASKYFKDLRTRSLVTFQDSYLGLNPYTAPAIFSLLSYAEFEHGNYLPQGGMYKVIEALEKIAYKNRVEIIYDKEVKKIMTNGLAVTEIIFKDTTTDSADYVIANSDLSYTYSSLLDNDSYANKLAKKKYSCSVITIHWGLDKKVPKLKTHNIFFSNTYKEGFYQVIEGKTPPKNPHFHIQAPTRTDSTRAPKDQDTITVMVPINHIYPDTTIDWDVYLKGLKAYIFDRLALAGISDIKDHIKFEISYTPKDWQSYLNLKYGSVYGLHHNLFQIGYFRPKRKHPKFKNLYFVGSSTHPGSGLPTVLLSSKFTVERILEDHRKSN